MSISDLKTVKLMLNGKADYIERNQRKIPLKSLENCLRSDDIMNCYKCGKEITDEIYDCIKVYVNGKYEPFHLKCHGEQKQGVKS
jgi:hypothetical protein